MTIKPKALSWLIRSLPNFLWPIKIIIIKNFLKKCGKNFHFGPNCIFFDHRLIEIGDHVFFGDYSVINSVVQVKIGNNVMFGPEVMIIGGDHNFKEIGIHMKDAKSGGTNLPVIIEDDVWIGSRTTILKGVNIYEGVVVGAGSLVTKNLPPYSICLGSPCKPIRCRFSRSALINHLQAVNSKYSIEDIESIYKSVDMKFDE